MVVSRKGGHPLPDGTRVVGAAITTLLYLLKPFCSIKIIVFLFFDDFLLEWS